MSVYGKPAGLPARLLRWADQLATDLRFPWIGAGIIEDLKLTASLLSSREFLDHLRTKGTAQEADFATEILADLDTLDAATDAARHVEGLPGIKHALGPVETIEKLDAEAVKLCLDYDAIRDVLVDTGALAEGDETTPVADLVRALLS